MQFCSDGHDEICHEGMNCPACREINARDVEIARLESKIDSLKAEIADLDAELDNLRDT